MKSFALAGVAAAFIAAPALASDPVIYDESIDGDFSNDGFATTDLGTLALGSSGIRGTMGTGAAFDPDYFTFTIASGEQLEMIVMSEYVTGTTIEASFIALQAGPQVTTEFDVSAFLGSTLIGTDDLGEDILDNIGDDTFGGNGFTGPLGPGTYSIWWQETATVVDYSFDFIVTQIPAPSTAFGLAAAGLLAARRRR